MVPNAIRKYSVLRNRNAFLAHTKTNTVTVENAMKATSDQKQQTPMRLINN